MCAFTYKNRQKLKCAKKHAHPVVECAKGVVYFLPLTCERLYRTLLEFLQENGLPSVF